MARKEAKLVIELMSDLCVASGYSYAGIVDNDVCYNESGFPFIPARRIKGCLRDAAKLIDIKNIDTIFGVGGKNLDKGILLSNAHMSGTELMDEEIKKLKKNHAPEAGYLTQQNILERFTYVKAQTCIDTNGVAKDNSLRFIRVVKQYNQLDTEKRVRFEAKIEYEDEHENEIKRILKALRHMGMDRNRGLGNIKCSLKDEKMADCDSLDLQQSDDREKVCIEYVICNEQPLMISNAIDSETETYISGQMVLGALAGSYLRNIGTAEDEAFIDLFLGEKAIYSNLYGTDYSNKDKIEHYIPAPLFINKLKKTKKYVNVVKWNHGMQVEDAYNPDNGNQFKQLKRDYVNLSDGIGNEIKTIEPETEIVYHHSKGNIYNESNVSDEEKEQGILYTMKVLTEKQYFAGTIVVEKRYLELMKALLKHTGLHFGKSRTAQYGKCELVSLKEKEIPLQKELKKGDRVIVLFESDGVFLDENGYTTRYDSVKRIIAENLGISYVENDKDHIYMQTKVINGYNTVWNLKKPSVPALRAGSAFEYELAQDTRISRFYVGEKCQEGFGKIRIIPVADMQYKVSCQRDEEKEQIELRYTKDILNEIIASEVLESLESEAVHVNMLNYSSSTLGRFILMVKESQNISDLRKRVESIKRERERNEIMAFLERYVCHGKKIDMISHLKDDALKTYVTETESVKKMVEEKWKDYLLNLLVHQKYKIAGSKQMNQE